MAANHMAGCFEWDLCKRGFQLPLDSLLLCIIFSTLIFVGAHCGQLLFRKWVSLCDFLSWKEQEHKKSKAVDPLLGLWWKRSVYNWQKLQTTLPCQRGEVNSHGSLMAKALCSIVACLTFIVIIDLLARTGSEQIRFDQTCARVWLPRGRTKRLVK